MAFFSDTFTDTDGVLLQNHTPDAGTSWTRLWGTTNTDLEINTNRLRQQTDTNSGAIYTADATYPSADYDVTFTLTSTVNLVGRPVYIFVRIQDQENMYAVYISKGTTISRLYKKVSGTWTALGSLFDEPADGSVCKLEIIGSTLKFYDDGVEVASATDTDISAAGKAGVGGAGGAELVATLDDCSNSNIIDTLTINDLGSGGITGIASITQAGDSVTSAGVLPIVGAASQTQANNTVVATGALPLVGTATITQAGDTLSATGVLPLEGTASVTQSGDTLSSVGVVTLSGLLAQTQADQTISATGTLPIIGALTKTQESDALVAQGSAGAVTVGVLEITQADNIVNAIGALQNIGLLSVTQDNNTVVGIGALAIKGVLVVTQENNTVIATNVEVLAVIRDWTLHRRSSDLSLHTRSNDLTISTRRSNLKAKEVEV